MERIRKDIQNESFHPVYLLYGEESYLKRYYKSRLQQAISGTNAMNITVLEERNINADTLFTMAQTLPFFASHRCIIVENSGWFKGKKKKEGEDEALADGGSEKLLACLKELPESTILIFVEEEVNTSTKLFKTVDKLGIAAAMRHPQQKDLELWIIRILKENQKKIISANLNKIIAYVGDSMERLSHELEKLLAYTSGQEEIREEDIDAVISISLESRVFAMVDEILAKRHARAMELYHEMILLRESPYMILYHIARQYNQMLYVKAMLQEQKSFAEIAKQLHINSRVAEIVAKKARTYDRAKLKERLKSCAEMEYRAKTGQIDEEIAVALLIMEE